MGRIVASGSGLLEFDGSGWRQLTTEGNLDWQTLAADRDGRVWAAANDEIGVFEPDASGTLHYRSLTSLLPDGERDLGDIWNLFLKDGGAIFVGRERVVWTDGSRAASWELPAQRRLYSWVDRGEIWISAESGRVVRMTAAGPLPISTPGFPSVPDLAWAEGLGSESWLALTRSGLISSSAEQASAFEPLNKLLSTSAPVSLLRLPDGRLAVATFFRGLFLIDTTDGSFEQLDDRSGLPSASVIGLMAGGDEWLWAVTTRGLGRLPVSPAVAIVKDQYGLDASSIKFVEPVAGGVVVGSDTGRFFVSLDGPSPSVKKTSSQWYHASARFGDSLLCGSMGGISRVTKEKGEKLIAEERDVVAIVADSGDASLIFYGTGSMVRAARWNAGRFEIVAGADMRRRIDSIVEGADRHLWVASGPVVTRLSFDAARDQFSVNGEIPFQPAQSRPFGGAKLFRIGDAVVGVVSGALMELAGGATSFAPVDALDGVEFVGITSGRDGEAWALARPGRFREESARIVRLRREGGSISAEEVGAPGVHALGKLGTLHLVDLPGGARELWVGAKDGIVRVDTARVRTAAALPTLDVRMTRRIDGVQSEVPNFPAEFPFNPGTIAFRWFAPDMARGDHLVETRIAGAEADWTPASEGYAREFARLGDGSYVFEARAVDALGRPGPVASRAFTVLPPWYRTPAAITGLCAAALAFGWIGWQMRLRVVRRRADELEELVDTRTRELARVNAEMTRFIARMNHEIRNPLNGLLGAVGILEQFAHTGREGRMMQILRACADHLGAVVEDVLDFTNIEGGRIVVQDRAFSVAEMVEAVPRMMLAEADRTGTEVVTTILPDVPSVVVADPDRIRQILVNFLGNALKYAPGEPVHIEVAATTVDEAPWLRLAVRDHGPGISEADKQNLFKMFERGRGAAKRKVRGMGIGLATCRLLARRMGGEVGVISGLGEGSEFFLKLPLKVEAGAVVQPDRLAQAELRGLACLIVEDQEFNRVILRDMLERCGCSVDEAADAETALSLAAMNRYDVVFTDLELPDAAPGEILKMLREQQSTADTQVPALVVTTAYATENVRQTCLAAGAAAFLAKPLSSSKLLAVLREIDSARRPAASVESATLEPVRETSGGMIHHLARIRGCSVRDVAAEIAGNIDDEVRQLQASVHLADSHEVGQRAHRLLSLAAMADAPELAGVATGIQNDARQGRMPTAGRLDALVAAMASARERLSSLTFDVSAGARSRAPGHSGPTASSHSD